MSDNQPELLRISEKIIEFRRKSIMGLSPRIAMCHSTLKDMCYPRTPSDNETICGIIIEELGIVPYGKILVRVPRIKSELHVIDMNMANIVSENLNERSTLWWRIAQ